MEEDQTSRFERMEKAQQELQEQLARSQQETKDQFARLTEIITALAKGKGPTEAPILTESRHNTMGREEPLYPPGFTPLTFKGWNLRMTTQLEAHKSATPDMQDPLPTKRKRAPNQARPYTYGHSYSESTNKITMTTRNAGDLILPQEPRVIGLSCRILMISQN